MIYRVSIFSVWTKDRHLIVSEAEKEDVIIECKASQYAYMVTDPDSPEPSFQDWLDERKH